MSDAGPVLLYSGGMDSFIAAYANPSARLLYIDTRARYANKEIRYLDRIAPREVILDSRLNLADVERDDLIVPARNLLLVALASHYGSDILLAATAGDKSTDKDVEFADLTSKLLTHIYASHHFPGKGAITVKLPFKDQSKGQMVGAYLFSGGNPQKLADTVSCYDPNLLHCGRCKACIRKWVALQIHGLAGLTPWDQNPADYDWGPIVEKIGSPEGWRCQQEDQDTLRALGL